MEPLEERLAKLLSRRTRKKLTLDGYEKAAVLILLYMKNCDYYIVLTKRTETVESHKGQISLPGGRFMDEDKTLEYTALRECFEEVGINPADVRILGMLDDDKTLTSNYIVTPIIGFIPYTPRFKKNSLEVEEILELPISVLKPENFQLEVYNYKGEEYLTYTLKYGENIIWGLTGRILKNFAEILSKIKKET
ncbi:CoA pyrophosphatase [Candidatus Bathyarchaeota archaeon]|nr:MAG: CoA pyrophosphatase [Candidatus Bathyarchaeota archaeon]